MHVTYDGIGSYRPGTMCPFCQRFNDTDVFTALSGIEDTYFCWECKRMCLLEPGLQSDAMKFSACTKPDVAIPVTPVTRCTVYRHKAARADEEWFGDEDDGDDEIDAETGTVRVFEAGNPNYTLVQDKTFASPVWDVTTLLRGDPPVISIGDSAILWDEAGRPRRCHWFVACAEGNVPL